ncbi:AEC family transporter, partial [Methylibium sp. T29]|uniref:AEC family transporter n=1 Tax=Methylibium sp. T29 TaxID=1430884 RepID=UPI0020A694F3
MQAILSVTVPFFALVLCGYLAARTRVMPEAAIPGLNAFVLFFALPCMLFRFGAGTPIGNLLNPTMLAVYTLAGLGLVALTVVLTLGARVHLKDAAFGALVAAFPNSGFMGMPMMTALIGAAAAGPVMVTLLVDMFIVSSVCLALAQMHAASHLPLGARLRNALRGRSPTRSPGPSRSGRCSLPRGW